MDKKPVGKVTHYFDKIGVAVIKLSGGLKEGDKISIKGHEKAFEQKVSSMQMEHEKVASAKKGQSLGMKVDEPVKEGDKVFKVA